MVTYLIFMALVIVAKSSTTKISSLLSNRLRYMLERVLWLMSTNCQIFQNFLNVLWHCSVQFIQSCLTLCDPMHRSTPGLPAHHQLPEFTHTHVHWVSDAIQPSHPLSSPSPPAPNPSQHQSLFQWVNSSHEVAKVLEFQLQIIPSKEIPGLISFRMDWLDLLAV